MGIGIAEKKATKQKGIAEKKATKQKGIAGVVM